MKKIGIVGRGFVGSAVEFGFSAQTGCDAQVRVYDKDPSKSIHTLKETINESDFIFLSVPTPSNSDGSMHLGILESVLQDIQSVNNRKDNIILINEGIEKTRKLETLIHEILHAICYNTGLEHDERQIEALSNGLFQLGIGEYLWKKSQKK